MDRERLLSSFFDRWREAKRADSGFFITWRTITYLLVFLGFLALASTGELGVAAMAAFGLLWATGYFLIKPPAFWREWMGKGVVWLALGGIGLIALQGRFVSVLYLMLFLALYKCFTLREALDHLHALIMAFFMFLACSVITTSLFYMVFLFGFIILLMLDMVCLTIAREGARIYAGFGSGLSAQTVGGFGGNAPVWRRLFLSSLFVGGIVLAMTLVFFLSIPHYSAYRIPNPWIRPTEDASKATSGYSDDVNFGALNQLKLDDTEVMKVFVQWHDGVNRPFPTMLRLRGQALDDYSEKRWTTHPRRIVRDSSKWDVISFQPLPASSGPLLRQRISQNLGSVRRLFGAAMPSQFRLDPKRHRFGYSNYYSGFQRSEFVEPFKLRLDWNTQAIQLIPMVSWGLNNIPPISYTVLSNVADDAMPLMRAMVRQSGGEAPTVPAMLDMAAASPYQYDVQPDPKLTISEEELAINTSLPETAVSEKLRAISRERARAATTPEKIIELMNWFYSDFEYSLSPGSTFGMHPLINFLTRTHRGHCEYFASAFVLLLRAQGIPARMATGFYTSETKESNDELFYIARQSDAHAWAEVWMNGYGWLTFDPTPPDWRGRATRMKETPTRWSSIVSDIKVIWQRYFLDYSEFQQAHLVETLKDNKFTRGAWTAGQALLETARSLVMQSDGSRLSNQEIYTRLILSLIALLLALLLLARFFSRERLAARKGVQRSRVAFMNQLMQRLQALGWKRAPSQTPAEWLGEIESRTEGRWQLEWVLELYHRCRFANEVPTADEESRVKELLRQLR